MKRHQWTPEQLAMLRQLYPDHRAIDVAAALGRRAGSVHQKAAALGLKKSAAFKTSDQSGRIQRGKQHPSMVASQFKPGLQPWNKGVPGSTGLHPNCQRTQFRKGEMSGAAQHNYVPIGSYRINADGHLERKTTDNPALAPARRWVPVYRLIWEAEHGSIPEGFIVVFRPGMKTKVLEQITTDRLECISRAENARRNHPRNKHPELARLVQLKGAITRQVNRINREAQEATT
jgi:hypothetical protein